MKVQDFINVLDDEGIEFYTGVPDSQLKALCDALLESSNHQHIIAANEGNAVGLAAGHYIATKKVPCVYLQNSGLGNIVNPCTSLTHPKVYGIPMVFVVGYRGEPGVKDEPQHVYQGEITLSLLQDLEIDYMEVSADTSPEECMIFLQEKKTRMQDGYSVAFVVKKNGLTKDSYMNYKNPYIMTRERAIEIILSEESLADVVISTTGKASREVFEIRERRSEGHEKDFLTVGSMGHCSMIGLGIALAKPDRKVCVLDGDGAMLMHMGAGAIIGQQAPKNMIHFVLNNQAHESVGGMPTAMNNVSLVKLGEAFGYRQSFSIQTEEELINILKNVKDMQGPILIEVMVAIGAREDLGRPTTTPHDNICSFMDYLEGC